MNLPARTLAELRARRGEIGAKRVVAGFDGFVDTIVTPVDLRSGPSDQFQPIASISAFAARVGAAAGKSTNIELYPRLEKLGGNSPIMSGALLAFGAKLHVIGALGLPTVHSVFGELSRRGTVIPLCEPARTTALEFPDGKIMLGQMRSFDAITLEAIVGALGEPALRDLLASADLIALLNWTMIPRMSEIFDGLLARVLPDLPSRARIFFFDLADPEKRTSADLAAALKKIAAFEAFGRVTLGLNLKEAQQVHSALGFERCDETPISLQAAAEEIRRSLSIATVVIHPVASAVCATTAGAFSVPGPYTAHPVVTTGAGDHFNAGFAAGQLLGLTPEACLLLGAATSGYYVRTACSPTLDDLETFLANWP